MKRKIYSLCILLLFSSMAFSQTKGRVTYRIISEQLTSDENDTSRKTFVKVMNNMSAIRDSIALNLDFNKLESIFYVDENTNIGLSDRNGYSSIMRSLNWYYRNDGTKTALERINSDKIYLVNSKTTDVIWNITNERKMIGKYNCIKAKTIVSAYTMTRGLFKKEIEAWFCPEIPIGLGPKNYGGLPGLIMELTDGKLKYYVKSLNLNPDFEIEIKKSVKGKLISQEEFFKAQPMITRENIKEYINN